MKEQNTKTLQLLRAAHEAAQTEEDIALFSVLLDKEGQFVSACKGQGAKIALAFAYALEDTEFRDIIDAAIKVRQVLDEQKAQAQA